jgi:arginyl-tRNA--protein-N-Asp/Glu arginylyltransferase
MVILQEPRISSTVDCPYIKGRRFTQEYFFAHNLNDNEFDYYLSRGWRRFGLYFFRPVCENCRACRPLRVSAGNLTLTKSQRRVVKKNSQTRVYLRPLTYRQELYEIYRLHSQKFGDEERDSQSFRDTYFKSAVPAFQSEYYIEDQLAAVGFLDMGASGLSSVYFSYDPRFSEYSLGTFSIIREAQLACENLLDWYYLGYYVKECPRMIYKGRFMLREIYDWEKENWFKE